MNFYEKKINHYFRIYDMNGDGVLSEEDILSKVRSFSKIEGFGPESAEAKHALEMYHGFYGPIFQEADINNDGNITREELQAYWKKILEMVQKDDPSVKPVMHFFHGAIDSIFDMLDVDNSDVIEFDEYDRYINSFNAKMEFDREAVFSAMDTDGNGRLSREEIHQMMEEYFLMVDENAVGNNFYGPLK